MRKSLKKILLVVTLGCFMHSCFDLEEPVFNQVSDKAYFTDANNVTAVLASVYAQMCMSVEEHFMMLAEYSADQITWRSWNGGGWGWDNAEKFVLSVQQWNPESVIIRNAWNKAWTTIGYCNNLIAELERINPSSVGMTDAQFDGYIIELRMIRAWSYYNAFEIWGGAIPIYTSLDVTQVPYSASGPDNDFAAGTRKVYDFIMSELDETLSGLSKKGDPGFTEHAWRMNQAINRTLKARLLLNSQLFIGQDRFAECATLCEQIIAGNFGSYSLADDHRKLFSIGNQHQNEMIFVFPTGNAQLDPTNTRNYTFLPYNAAQYLGGTNPGWGLWGCTCLTPSYDNSGTVKPNGGTDNPVCFLDPPYNDKLGATYERFHDLDVRKKNYRWENGNYTGMFMRGPMYHYATGEQMNGDADRNNMPLDFVDQIGTFQNMGRELKTVMNPRWGEMNSGVRLLKYPLAPRDNYPSVQSGGPSYPGHADGFDVRDIYEVEFRFSEIVYMLAECRMRAGNSSVAVDLINSVRQRYFSASDWATIKDTPPRPFTTFDMDWLLSEWGLEFLHEGRRRRTDLRRFDKFTQGQWYFYGRDNENGFEPFLSTRNRKYEWFPLPERALSVNPNLRQNPDYL